MNSMDDDQNKGWPRLAELMAEKPDFEAFPRFRELNVKTLLYLQVELESLSTDLKEEERRDRRSGKGHDEADFSEFADHLVVSDSTQWKLVKKLRVCLEQYNRFLLQYAQISAMHEPNSRDMRELRIWLRDSRYGDFLINGQGSDAWGSLINAHIDRAPTLAQHFRQLVCSIFWKQDISPTRPDLVAPRPRQTLDALTRWVGNELIPVLHLCRFPRSRPKVDDIESGIPDASEKSDEQPVGTSPGGTGKEKVAEEKFPELQSYLESTMLRYTSYIATVTACTLPTVAIAVLSTAGGNLQKLLYIAGFTVMFSIGLVALSNETTRVQIFTATAAFSAVLVVFVQNQ